LKLTDTFERITLGITNKLVYTNIVGTHPCFDKGFQFL